MRLREGKLVSEWKDEHGNRALIEEVEIKPHKEAKTEKVYRLSCYAEYDNDFCYYISIFESIESAERQLEEFSCGIFRNELITKAKNIIHALKSEYGNFIDMNKNDIEKIKSCNALNDKEKVEMISLLERIVKAYIDNLVNRFIIDYDEAKILYAYLKK